MRDTVNNSYTEGKSQFHLGSISIFLVQRKFAALQQ